MLRVADRNGALHSEKGIASKAARRKGKKTFGHLIGERLPGEGWKWEGERWERQNPDRNSFGLNKQALLRTPSLFFSLAFPTRGACPLACFVQPLACTTQPDRPARPGCCLPGSTGASASGAFQLLSTREVACTLKTKRKRTVKQRWRCRESEQARFSFAYFI